MGLVYLSYALTANMSDGFNNAFIAVLCCTVFCSFSLPFSRAILWFSRFRAVSLPWGFFHFSPIPLFLHFLLLLSFSLFLPLSPPPPLAFHVIFRAYWNKCPAFCFFLTRSATSQMCFPHFWMAHGRAHCAAWTRWIWKYKTNQKRIVRFDKFIRHVTA